jgi:sugar-specific transcriptional regulator TrmB
MADELHRSLRRVAEVFDFGEYEVQAYLTVLEHGEMTAAEVASEADIPQPRVYDTVRDLAANGFLEVRESRPMTVSAVDPEDAFGDVQTSLDDLVADLKRRYTAPSLDSEALSLVRSQSTILRYIGEVVDDAEYELVLSLTPDLVGRFERSLRDARERDVDVDLTISPAADVPDPAEFDYAAVATRTRTRRGVTTPVVAVADGTYSVYATRDALSTDRERYGVVFDRSELGFLVSGFFDTVVQPTSQTIVEATDELEWPRQYATIRRCLRDVRATQNDGPFYVTVHGRDVETGDPRSVAGRLVDYSASSEFDRAALTIETDEGTVSVGGQLAALEDVEARAIRIGREGPP